MSSHRSLISWCLTLMLFSSSFLVQSQVQERIYSSNNREAVRLVDLAKENMNKRDYSQAILLLNKALHYQPDHTDAYFNRAISKEMVQNPQGALTDYQIVLLLDSTYWEAAFNGARLRYRQKQYQRAIADFKKALTMSSGQTRMVYFKGTPLNGNGAVPIQAITTTNGMDADIHNFIGLCYQALEDFEASVVAIGKAISLDPYDANYYVNRGLSEASQGNHQKALADFQTALSLEPNHPIAQFNLTKELELSENLELAAYDEIILRNPTYSSAYVSRALAKMNTGDIKGALEDYDQAIVLDPNDPLFYLNRGLARDKIKYFRAALADFNKVIKLDPSNATAYRSRGKVLFELKEFQLALEDLDQAIQLDPGHGGSFFNRALIHRQIGHLDQSCTDLEQARRLGITTAISALQSYCNSTN